MPDKLVQQKEFSELFIKILFPAFLTVAIGVAIEMKNNKSKVTALNASLSLLIGVGTAYLFSGVILENCKGGMIILCASLVTSFAEKIAKFLMYKFDVDLFLKTILELLLEKIKNLLK